MFNTKVKEVKSGPLLELSKFFIPHAIGHLGIKYDQKHLSTNEFPPTDPWSRLSQQAVEQLAEQGFFDKQEVFEVGMGDAKQSVLAVIASKKNSYSVKKVIGVDVTRSRLALAYHNLKNLEVSMQFIQGDAVDALEAWTDLGNQKFGGKALICLPQVPRQEDIDATADVYNSQTSHKPFSKNWERYGLTLNAATLTRLKEVSNNNTEALLVLSGRLPENIRERLIRETGWQNNGTVVEGIVRQDPDTPLNWMNGIAREINDGSRFYANEAGKQTISMLEAISMHQRGKAVYHDVYVYRLGLESKL